MHGVFLFFMCSRDAGLHLGAGYRSDPTGGDALFHVFSHLHALHDACLGSGVVDVCSAGLITY